MGCLVMGEFTDEEFERRMDAYFAEKISKRKSVKLVNYNKARQAFIEEAVEAVREYYDSLGFRKPTKQGTIKAINEMFGDDIRR